MAMLRHRPHSKPCLAGGGDDDNNDDDYEYTKTSKNVKGKLNHGCLLREFHACPEYLRDNEFILSHYRADFSLSQSLYSLFQIHNETVNIWTHLLGFFLFLGLTIFTAYELGHLPTFVRCIQGLSHNISDYCLLQSMKNEMHKVVAPIMNQATRWPFYVFMGGSMFCLLASAICHLFTCHSEKLAIFLMRIDYAGIATMIATSFFPPIYYVFQCEPIWQWIYLGTISTMGVITVGVLFAPSLQSGKYRPFRTMLFMSMGMSGIIPAMHGIVTNWNEPQCQVTIAYEAVMASCYAIGAIIYVVRIPERWRPGWFDLGGHSHNLFHIFVIGGAIAHYQAALLFIEWRDAKGCH